MVLKNEMRPIHPGKIIKEVIMPEVGMSMTEVARKLGVTRQMYHGILSGKYPLSAAMCFKISKLFGSTPEHWMRLQGSYDLKKAAQDERLKTFVAGIEPVKAVGEMHR